MSMSIDEAIAHAREVAEKQRKDNENCKYKAEYGCKGCADYYSKPCIECAKEHEQLAEWLEDYKQIKMLVPLEQALKKEYCKGIDDFITKLDYESGYDEDFNDDECIYEISRMTLLSIAEQLKAGDNNG